MIRIAIYLLSIILANVITARFAPMELGLFIIPYGTLFIDLHFLFYFFYLYRP